MAIREKSPSDKLEHVKQAYTNRIIPSIKRAYENAGVIEGTYILIHCCILSLSGYFKGAKKTNKQTYISFIKEFFPENYEPETLWTHIRNNLIHSFTFPPISKMDTYVLTYLHPELHLKKEIREAKEREGRLIFRFINLENFFQDLEQATHYYFKRVEKDKELLDKLHTRYNFAKPVVHISDKAIVYTKDQLIEYKKKLFSGINLTNKQLIDKKISEFLEFGHKNYMKFDESAKIDIDEIFDKLSQTIKKNIKEMPNGILKRKYSRMHAIGEGQHSLVQQYIDFLEKPVKTKKPILAAIRGFFIPKTQHLLDLLFDVSQNTLSGPYGPVQLSLFYICFHELLVSFHLTQKIFVAETSPHIRRIYECLDLVNLFTKEPKWVDLWISDNQKEIWKQLRPAKVREKLGKEKFDPKSAFFSELGVHATFKAIQARTGKSTELSEKGHKQLLVFLGGQAYEHQLINVNLALIEALISVVLSVGRTFLDFLDKKEFIEIIKTTISEYKKISHDFFIKWVEEENMDVSEFKKNFKNNMALITENLEKLEGKIKFKQNR